ncbi:MAG TPA: murein L,D-transpeptidase catalytic domain family protein [Flavisolibacter sp.]
MKTVKTAAVCAAAFLLTMCSPVQKQQPVQTTAKRIAPIDRRAGNIRTYAQAKGFSTRYCFLVDMRMQSGLKRFFVYDLEKNSVISSGLVAHGSCGQGFLTEARFSNTPGGGCSSTGIYKVGVSYVGQYGKSYRLHGLQPSNSNAYKRAVVLHAYKGVPDEEIYPRPLCNSFGCPMVSTAFFKHLASLIDRSDKPILLWVYDDV